jgi:predicted small secreted protein
MTIACAESRTSIGFAPTSRQRSVRHADCEVHQVSASPITEATMYIKIFTAALLLAFTAGCNTMEGAGKDIQKTGQSIEQSAQKHKNGD